MQRLLGAVMLAVVVTVSSTNVTWGMVCGFSEVVTTYLEERKENFVGGGIAKDGGLTRLFSAKQGETWTLIVGYPNVTCFLDFGEDWEEYPKPRQYKRAQTTRTLQAQVVLTTDGNGNCDKKATVFKTLLNNYNEKRDARGVSQTGRLVELVISPKGETWSLVRSFPQGVSCLFKSGDYWQKAPAVPSVWEHPDR